MAVESAARSSGRLVRSPHSRGPKKRSFDGVYEASNNLIDSSPWEIKGLLKRPQKGAGIQTGMFSTAKEFGSNLKEIFS